MDETTSQFRQEFKEKLIEWLSLNNQTYNLK